MSKRFNSALFAATLLSLTACTAEDPVAPGGDGTVTFTVTMPGQPGTRAFADGVKANELTFCIYDVTDDEAGSFVYENKQERQFTADKDGKLSCNLSVDLVKGRSYEIIWWAQNPACKAYELDKDKKTITVSYAGTDGKPLMANDDSRDAFYAHTAPFKVEGTASHPVTLTRPFAQVNFGTSDMTEANKQMLEAAYGVGYRNLVSSVTVKAGIPTTLSLVDGKTSGATEEDVVFGAAAPTDDLFPVAGNKYLAMEYILADERGLADLTLSVRNATEECSSVSVPSAPVKANYRTNIYGKLLTSPQDFEITIDPAFDSSYDNGKEYLDGKALLAAVSAGEPYTIPANTVVTLGKSSTGTESLSLTNADLTIDGVLIIDQKIDFTGDYAKVKGNGKIEVSRFMYFHDTPLVEISGVEINDPNSRYMNTRVIIRDVVEAKISDVKIYDEESTCVNIDPANVAKCTIDNCNFYSEGKIAISIQKNDYSLRNFGYELLDTYAPEGNPIIEITNSTVSAKKGIVADSNDKKIQLSVSDSKFRVFDFPTTGGYGWDIADTYSIGLSNVDATLADCYFYSTTEWIDFFGFGIYGPEDAHKAWDDVVEAGETVTDEEKKEVLEMLTMASCPQSIVLFDTTSTVDISDCYLNKYVFKCNTLGDLKWVTPYLFTPDSMYENVDVSKEINDETLTFCYKANTGGAWSAGAGVASAASQKRPRLNKMLIGK